jgi:tight adherence protein C
MLLLGIQIPLYAPLGASVLVAVFTMYMTHREVLTKAARARAEFTRAMCTYLGLSASQVLDGHGPMESLERSAEICHGWVFVRIRGALMRAQLMLMPPWDELKRLANEINVIELSDLADIMRTAGSEGANVAETLRARSDSLRDQIRAEALSEAEVRTSKLDIPASALILVLIVLIGYPFMARLF